MFGFAVSSKLNDAMFMYVCVFAFAIAGIAVLWGRKPEKNISFFKSVFGVRLIALVISGLLVGLTGYGLFVALNPQVQGDTMKKVEVIQDSVNEFFKRRANSQTSKNRQAKKVLVDVTYKKPGKAFNLISRRNFMVDDTEKYYGTFGSLVKFKGNFMDGLFLLIGLAALVWIAFNKLIKEKKIKWVIISYFFFLEHIKKICYII